MRATGRPRSVIVTDSPATTRLTTADAFCFSARIPTSATFYNVAHNGRSYAGLAKRFVRSDIVCSDTVRSVDRARYSPDRLHQGFLLEEFLGCPELR